MQTRKRQIIEIILHLLFWIVVCILFCIFSFLRPMALVYWKEIVSVLFIGGMVYLHYFVLIPRLLLREKKVLFWICALLLLVVTVSAEMLLVDSDIHKRAVWIKDFTLYYVYSFFFLFLRDFSFFLCFLLLKLYHAKAILLEKVEKMVMSETYKLIIISPNEKPQLIDFNDIAYFSFENGEIVVTLKNGEKMQRKGSLSELENMIPSELWVRVNRQTLVMRDCIVRYTPTALYVDVNGMEGYVPYYSTKQHEVLELLKAWNAELYSSDDSRREKLADADGQPLSDDLKRLLDYLNEHPDASVQQVAKALYFSTRTAQRRMTELRQLGLLDSSKRG